MILEESFYSYFFKNLFSKNVNYLILKNYENFPKLNNSRDIDILIDKDNLNQVLKILNHLTKIKVVRTFKKVNGISIFLYGIKRANGSYSMQLDFLWKISWKGISYLDAKKFLKNKQKKTKNKITFFIPNDNDSIKFLVLSQILLYGFIKKKYSLIVKKKLKKKKLFKLLQKDIGHKNSLTLSRNIKNKKNLLWLRLKIFIYFILKKDTTINFINLLNYFIDQFFSQRFKKNKQTIVFLGPDGSGKTTIIRKLKKKLDGVTCVTDIYHLKQKIWFFNKRVKKRGTVTDPHKYENRNYISSCAKVLLWAIGEYFFSALYKPRYPKLCILDRYFYDLMIDPKRYRYGGSFNLLKILNLIIPQPDLLVILFANPKIIYNRKKEINYNDLVMILKKYKNFNLKKIKTIKINTSKSIQETTNLICKKFIGITKK